jgi:stearoyl-CoA desaturase (delta-9 desaturase)
MFQLTDGTILGDTTFLQLHLIVATLLTKAQTLPLILYICELASVFLNICSQYPIFSWVRDHRVHHKYTETDADPHNARRGLFFSHMGWVMLENHPEVKRRAKEIDMSDIEADPVIQFEEK